MKSAGWNFVDAHGTFEMEGAGQASTLYLPLTNPAGMASCVTPSLNGDAKADQNSFLLLPTSLEDLHNSRAARNFWVLVDGQPWSATGGSAEAIVQKQPATLTAGLLWQTVARKHAPSGLDAEVTSFVPMSAHKVELMRVVLTNRGKAAIHLMPTAAIPIFGRSADNLRDHRHVTSLLHRTECVREGVIVTPTLSFDERGHTHNTLRYAVLGVEGDGTPPVGFTPLVEDFIGEGGSLDWPAAVVEKRSPAQGVGGCPPGFESIAALHFTACTLTPGESAVYVLMLGILPEGQKIEEILGQYGSAELFEHHLQDCRAYWQEVSEKLVFTTPDERFNGWLKWVGIQPVLRRWMGNSFLPAHDYGRGGRGWRDLWQDALALLLTDPDEVSGLLFDSFAGVRMDGSNATIIGARSGEFKADRNNIPRVWMDHGAWPYLSVRQYIDLTGDLDFLLSEQVYFKDQHSHRCKRLDSAWEAGAGTQLKTAAGTAARGSLLEHMLAQHLSAFYNTGEHNLIRLEGADWNDALDMAAERGESAAFSALYAANLAGLAELCRALAARGQQTVALAEEVADLIGFDDYGSSDLKNRHLQAYYDRVAASVSGKTREVALTALADDLQGKADWLAGHLHGQEWITNREGFGWFNGYYDNLGRRVEGDAPNGVRMTLTGQVFTLMGGIATQEQARQIVRSAERYLYDAEMGGYRLNTDFGEGVEHLGRAFGFAFGHKENGAMFSHMAVMFANALYKRGLAAEGWKTLAGIYQQSQDFARGRMYPGIPEYFNSRGRGMYPFLTGSASWYLLTLLGEVYGVKGRLGDLVLAPRIAAGQGRRHILALGFAGKRLEIEYILEGASVEVAGRIMEVQVNGRVRAGVGGGKVLIPRTEVEGWPEVTHLRLVLADEE